MDTVIEHRGLLDSTMIARASVELDTAGNEDCIGQLDARSTLVAAYERSTTHNPVVDHTVTDVIGTSMTTTSLATGASTDAYFGGIRYLKGESVCVPRPMGYSHRRRAFLCRTAPAPSLVPQADGAWLPPLQLLPLPTTHTTMEPLATPAPPRRPWTWPTPTMCTTSKADGELEHRRSSIAARASSSLPCFLVFNFPYRSIQGQTSHLPFVALGCRHHNLLVCVG